MDKNGGIKLKTSKQMERHLKGIANHWRIDILLLVSEHKDLTMGTIAKTLRGNFRTLSIHTHSLVNAGLLRKKYKGRNVIHSLSPYGQTFVRFLITFQHS